MIDYLYYCYDVRIKKLIKKYRNKKWAYIKIDSGGSYVAMLLFFLLCPIILTIVVSLIGDSDVTKWTSMLFIIILFAVMDHYFNKKEYHQRVYRKYKSIDIYILPMWILYLMYFVCGGIGILLIPLIDNILDPI
jgi:hypothetical protein